MNDSKTKTKLKPFWGKIMVMESPVDEHERESGLLVPLKFDGADGIRRGIVAGLDMLYEETGANDYPYEEIIPVGTVVYYTGGQELQGYVFLRAGDIIACEGQ